MEKMHQQRITVDGDDSVHQFLQTKKSITAQQYKGDLKKFVLFLKETNRKYTTLAEYLDLIYKEKTKNLEIAPSKRIYFGEKELQIYIHWLQENGQSGRTIKRSGNTLIGYLKCYDVHLNPTKYSFPHATGLKHNKKHQWTTLQIKELIASSKTLRNKAIYACIFQSGLAISDFLTLDYWDVKGKLDDPPVLIDLTRKKTGQTYRTFFGTDSCYYLKEYLATRKRLIDTSPLFSSEGNYSRLDQRVNDSSIHDARARCSRPN